MVLNKNRLKINKIVATMNNHETTKLSLSTNFSIFIFISIELYG